MATKYDCFEILFKNKSLMNARQIADFFPRENYATIYKQLCELIKENLAEKKDTGFQVVVSKKTELLFSIIEHCLRNQINYNLLLDKNFACFIKNSLEQKEVNLKSSGLNSRTFKKYITALETNQLAIILSEKPFIVKVFYNPLINNLLLFFDFTNLDLNKDKTDYSKKIEKELEIFKTLRKKNEARYSQILQDIQINFIYHSLSIEGNPATLLDTQRIIREEIIPENLRIIDAEEIRNYREALIKMLSDVESDKLLSIPLILEYHKISMKHKIPLAGQIRTKPVYIKGNPDFKTIPPEKILKELTQLLEEYENFSRSKKNTFHEVLDFAVYFHNTFQHIHPFEDGNSRTTRLITFQIFQQKQIPLMDIPYGLLEEYVLNTKGSTKRDDEKLKETLQKIILFNLIKMNKLFK